MAEVNREVCQAQPLPLALPEINYFIFIYLQHMATGCLYLATKYVCGVPLSPIEEWNEYMNAHICNAAVTNQE